MKSHLHYPAWDRPHAPAALPRVHPGLLRGLRGPHLHPPHESARRRGNQQRQQRRGLGSAAEALKAGAYVANTGKSALPAVLGCGG